MTSTMRFDKWQNSLGQPYGTVLQVVQAVKTDTFSTSSTSFVDITGFSATITPKFANSKILVQAVMSVNADANNTTAMFKLFQGSTEIGLGDAAGSRLRTAFPRVGATPANNINVVSSVLDSPTTTSATTYKIQIRTEVAGNSVHVNRSGSDGDSAVAARSISTITLTEIAQ